MKIKFTDSPVAEHVSALNVNGLNGRMLRLPAKDPKNKKEILFIYGIHTTIERMATTAQFLSNYGTVTMPDLPGIGGMDTFYSIGLKPDFDTYADYLASFIKLKFKNKKYTLVGMSFGFVIVTRMLQRHPELRKNITNLYSLVGIADRSDFKPSRLYNISLKLLFQLFAHNPTSWFMKTFILRKNVIGIFYKKHAKTAGKSKAERREVLEYETYLWQCNELKTYGNLMYDLFTLRQPDIKIPMHLDHMGTGNDQWLDNQQAIKNMERLYKEVTPHKANMDNHGASLISTEEEVASFVPDSIKQLLGNR